jgi:hypothetical protein
LPEITMTNITQRHPDTSRLFDWVEALMIRLLPPAALMEPDDIKITDSMERDIERTLLFGSHQKSLLSGFRSPLHTRGERTRRQRPLLNVRRTTQGQIDFDFYRTRATALRGAAQHDGTPRKFLIAGIALSVVTLAMFVTIAATRPVTVVEHIAAPARTNTIR